MTREIMIVTGEASGDLHGANLVRSLKKLQPDLTFCGMGGRELERAGTEILFEASKISVVGFFEVVSHLKDILTAQKRLRERLVASRPKLLILIDFPDFNLLLARKAKKLDIPVFYYVSPQVWAWRSGRVKTMARFVDTIGVILPFEEQFYRDRGVNARYVGHPLLDSVRVTKSREVFCAQNGLDPGRTIIGILPGSRSKEVRRLLPVFLESAKKLCHKAHIKPIFLIPCASTITKEDLFENGINKHLNELEIHIIFEERYNMMASCDIVIAASGTVTLELLLLNTPMIVAYRLTPLTYRLGRLLVKVKFFALANLIADREIVPELLQDEATPERISSELYKLLFEESLKEKMKADFKTVQTLLGKPGASNRAAALALELIRA